MNNVLAMSSGVEENHDSESLPAMVNGIAGEILMTFIQRVEKLEEEKKNIAEDIKEVMSEAKSQGFDIKIIRKLISMRKREKSELYEEQELLDIYMRAIGMVI